MSSSSELYDVIVVGGGIIGSCTAYHAQKSGLKTALLEQYSFGHAHGSSSGQSRIIRYAHTDPEYLPLVHESFKQIAEMEEKRGEKLWVKCGLLWMGKKHEIDDVARILKNFNCEHDVLTAEEVMVRYPQFKYDSAWSGLVDPMGGVILADKWLSTYQDEYRKLGGVAVENCRVDSYVDDGVVRLQTSRGEMRARHVVFAVGTWINKLAPQLPVQSRNELISVAYWKAKNEKDDAHMLNPERYPCVVVNTDGIGYYSLPSVDYPGAVKYAYHEGQVYDDVDRGIIDFDMKYVERTREHLANHVPVLASAGGPWRIDRCKYAMSPDDQYIVDRLPGSKNIVIAGCMSGTGFKNGPSLGLAITQWMRGEKTSVDIAPFSLRRFNQANKKAKL